MDWRSKGFNKRPRILWKLRQNRDPIPKHSEKSLELQLFKQSYLNFKRSVLVAILATHKTTSFHSPIGRFSHPHRQVEEFCRPGTALVAYNTLIHPLHMQVVQCWILTMRITATAIISVHPPRNSPGNDGNREQTQDNYCAMTRNQVVNLRPCWCTGAMLHHTTRQPCISTSTYMSTYVYCRFTVDTSSLTNMYS